MTSQATDLAYELQATVATARETVWFHNYGGGSWGRCPECGAMLTSKPGRVHAQYSAADRVMASHLATDCQPFAERLAAHELEEVTT